MEVGKEVIHTNKVYYFAAEKWSLGDLVVLYFIAELLHDV